MLRKQTPARESCTSLGEPTRAAPARGGLEGGEVEPDLHRAFVETLGVVEAEQMAKVEVLRARIAAGDYRPDPELIAERMLAALCPSPL